MKNKEIEELLNNIKQQLIIDERLGKEIAKDFHKTTLNYKEIKILLSYIEQLENNRDKTNEYIKIELSQGGERELRGLVDGYEVLKLLKGDSDV